MKTQTITWLAIASLAGFVYAGCEDDDADTTTAQGTTSQATTSSTTGNGGSGAAGGSADSYVFDTTPFDSYTQTDRHGAVEAGTVGIAVASGLGLNGEDIAIRDDYNASTPEDDAAGDWVPEISASVGILHMVLDDDLTDAGLTPASNATSLAQAGPVIVPDTIKYNPAQPTGYPNGRALTDPVVDITVAAALLDLSVHGLSTLADLPLNPPENDVPFKTAFPYLADPH